VAAVSPSGHSSPSNCSRPFHGAWAGIMHPQCRASRNGDTPSWGSAFPREGALAFVATLAGGWFLFAESAKTDKSFRKGDAERTCERPGGAGAAEREARGEHPFSNSRGLYGARLATEDDTTDTTDTAQAVLPSLEPAPIQTPAKMALNEDCGDTGAIMGDLWK